MIWMLLKTEENLFKICEKMCVEIISMIVGNKVLYEIFQTYSFVSFSLTSIYL